MKHSAGRALFRRWLYNGNHKCSHSKSASVHVEGIMKPESRCSGCEWTLSGSISGALKHITLATPASPDGADVQQTSAVCCTVSGPGCFKYLVWESCRSCVVGSPSLYQTLGRGGPSYAIQSKPRCSLGGHASVWKEAPEYIQKVACSALIAPLCGKLPTFKVLIKPLRNGSWVTDIYDSTVAGINSPICITHQQQIRLSVCVRTAFAHERTFWNLLPKDKYDRVFTRNTSNIHDFQVVPKGTIAVLSAFLAALNDLCSSHCPTRKGKSCRHSFQAVILHLKPAHIQKSRPYWSFRRWVTPR